MRRLWRYFSRVWRRTHHQQRRQEAQRDQLMETERRLLEIRAHLDKMADR